MLSDQTVDELREFFGSVFLQEMSGTLDDGVWLAFGTGHTFLEYSFSAGSNGVAIAESRQERLVELAEHFPGSAIRRLLTPDQRWHDPRTCDIAFIWKGRTIGIQFGLGQFAYGSHLQDHAAVEFGHGLTVLQPAVESFFELEFRVRIRLVPLATDDKTVIASASDNTALPATTRTNRSGSAVTTRSPIKLSLS